MSLFKISLLAVFLGGLSAAAAQTEQTAKDSPLTEAELEPCVKYDPVAPGDRVYFTGQDSSFDVYRRVTPKREASETRVFETQSGSAIVIDTVEKMKGSVFKQTGEYGCRLENGEQVNVAAIQPDGKTALVDVAYPKMGASRCLRHQYLIVPLDHLLNEKFDIDGDCVMAIIHQ